MFLDPQAGASRHSERTTKMRISSFYDLSDHIHKALYPHLIMADVSSMNIYPGNKQVIIYINVKIWDFDEAATKKATIKRRQAFKRAFPKAYVNGSGPGAEIKHIESIETEDGTWNISFILDGAIICQQVGVNESERTLDDSDIQRRQKEIEKLQAEIESKIVKIETPIWSCTE